MFDHISLGVKDLAITRCFYDQVLAPLGSSLLGGDGIKTLGYGLDKPMLWFALVPRPVPADPESGLPVCFDAVDRAAVDAFYEAALAAGATDNGAPGMRPEYGDDYYAAFVVDPDGYRLEAYCSIAR